MPNQSLSDERLITALKMHARVTDAARSVGLRARELYQRLGEPEFQAKWQASRQEHTKRSEEDRP